MKLSVVIPAFNEEKNLKRGVLDSVYDYLKLQKYSTMNYIAVAEPAQAMAAETVA